MQGVPPVQCERIATGVRSSNRCRSRAGGWKQLHVSHVCQFGLGWERSFSAEVVGRVEDFVRKGLQGNAWVVCSRTADPASLGCWCLAFLPRTRLGLVKGSGATSILTPESFLLGGAGGKGQQPESSLSSYPNCQSSLGSSCQDCTTPAIRLFPGPDICAQTPRWWAPATWALTKLSATQRNLRRVLCISLLLQGQGDTTEVITVPPTSPQHQRGENHTTPLIATKWPQKMSGAACQHSTENTGFTADEEHFLAQNRPSPHSLKKKELNIFCFSPGQTCLSFQTETAASLGLSLHWCPYRV